MVNVSTFCLNEAKTVGQRGPCKKLCLRTLGYLSLSTTERLFKAQYILVQVLLAYLKQYQVIF